MNGPGPCAPPEAPVVRADRTGRPFSWTGFILGGVGSALWPVLLGGGVAISVGGVLATGAAAAAILGLVALLAHRGGPIPVQVAAGLPVFGAICLIPVLPVILGGIAVGVGYLVSLGLSGGHLESPAVHLLIVGVSCAVYGLMAAVVAGLIGRIRLRRAGFTPADRSRS